MATAWPVTLYNYVVVAAVNSHPTYVRIIMRQRNIDGKKKKKKSRVRVTLKRRGTGTRHFAKT